MSSIYKDVYNSGSAVGDTDIKNDTMVFRYFDEVIEVPLAALPHIPSLYNGYFYVLPIGELRKIAAKKE